MSDVNYLDAMFPGIGQAVGRVHLARLPTPLNRVRIRHKGRTHELSIKLDNQSSPLYGGNKVRKLEYLLKPGTRHPVRRYATFGTVGSNHALATAIYARQLGFECTCFLAHQKPVDTIVPALGIHAGIGSEIVPFGGSYSTRLKILRHHLWGRDARVIPMGGSSWTGTLGFVNAGLELAAQIAAGEIPLPKRVYVATGTMGTAAGLALGLALAGLPAEVQAVRVSDLRISNEEVLQRLMRKTVLMMHRLDAAVPEDLAQRTRIRLRHEFFAGGYAQSDASTEEAVQVSRDQLGVTLEATYTGKAMAALLDDLGQPGAGVECLFWNTFNPASLSPASARQVDLSTIPRDFHRYFAR